MDAGGVNLLDWYWEMPPVTRFYLTACTVSTAACALEVITPYHLYYNWHAIRHGGQLWRLGTNFLFFGSWGIDFLFHMYFLVNYCRKLEESSFAGRPGDFAACLLFGAGMLMTAAPWFGLMFYGSSLSFMAVYLFARAHPGMQVQLLGLIPFTAPWLPWVLLAFSALLGHDVTSDGLGMAVGHVYFLIEDVWPALAEARGWKVRRLFPNPSNVAAGLTLLQQGLASVYSATLGRLLPVWLGGNAAEGADGAVEGGVAGAGAGDDLHRAPVIVNREVPLPHRD